MNYNFCLGKSLFEVIYAENMIRMTVGQQDIFNIFAVEFADKLRRTFAQSIIAVSQLISSVTIYVFALTGPSAIVSTVILIPLVPDSRVHNYRNGAVVVNFDLHIRSE